MRTGISPGKIIVFPILCALVVNAVQITIKAATNSAVSILAQDLHWSASTPLAGPVDYDGHHYYSLKDPSFVRVKDRWHVFCTVRGQNQWEIEYLTFTNWNHVAQGERHILGLSQGNYCAPTVFYFTPQKTWYLLYQYAGESQKNRSRWPVVSTNGDIGDWQHWSKPDALYSRPGEWVPNWIDFWIICDEYKAYLFFTCDNGTLWRAETLLNDFPHGWSQPVLALKGPIFEAGHIYAVKGTDHYMLMIEDIGPGGERYFKSYMTERLDGQWRPVAATWERPFASKMNVSQPDGHWTDSISHGELFRAGVDEKMEIESAGVRVLFQGVTDKDMRGKPYGVIPWRLGILTPKDPLNN
jgi:hypothetical protein